MGRFAPPPPRGWPSRAPVRRCVCGRPLREITGGPWRRSAFAESRWHLLVILYQ